MRVVVITAPEPDLDLEMIKRHLNVEHDDDDALITGLAAASTAWLDGPGGWLGRAIGLQTLELRLSDFHEHHRQCRRDHAHPDEICLPFPPLAEVVSIKYLDNAGVEQVLVADTDYEASSTAVRPAYGKSWPSGRHAPESVKIRYGAGYEVPPSSITQARLLLIGHWFANRQAVVGVENRDSSAPLPIGAEALLSTFRVWN